MVIDMSRTINLLVVILAIMFLVGCQTTNPEVTSGDDADTEETTDQTNESEEVGEIGVIEQVTPDEEPDTDNQSAEEPEKPDEDITEETTNQVVIEIDDLKFIPNKLNISQGTTVVWEHKDEYAGNDHLVHTLMVYPPEGAGFQSPRMLLGDTFNYTFTEPGEYWYISIVFKNRMRGYITVD